MILQTLSVISPLLVLTGGVLLLNWSSLRSAGAALALLVALTLAAQATTGLPAGLSLGGIWLGGLSETVILAGMVVLTLFFGLLLHRLMEASGRLGTLLSLVRVLGRNPTERLLWVVVVIGPLFESISGFGLGVVIVVPILMALGYAPLQVMALSLLTQLAVPWGALAIGMGLGATMTGLPMEALGPATALLAAPVYLAFWCAALVLAIPGWEARLKALPTTMVALGVFAVAVWAANRWVSPELGGVIGPPALALWLQLTGAGLAGAGLPRNRHGMEEGATPEFVRPRAREMLRAVLPYGVLVALLFVTRYHAPLTGWLNTHAVLRLPGSPFVLPLLYNPGATLAVACLAAVPGVPSGRLPGLLGETVGQWTRAALAVFALIGVARALHGVGMVAILAGWVPEGGGSLVTPLAVSIIAGLGGFLTGSVAGANALFINVQAALATQSGLPLLWAAAVQNTLAAASTAFSPARVVFAATMTGRHGEEGQVLRKLLPLAAVVFGIGTVALLPGVVEWLEVLEPWVTGGSARG